MKLPFVKEALNESGTNQIAEEFAKFLKAGNVVALSGNLGSGKTFFVKEICKYYGIEGVTSPTFSIVNEYEGKYLINHFDFYRIKNIEELYDIGFEDYLMKERSITFIEWADLFTEVLPSNFIKVDILTRVNSGREFTIEYNK